MYSLLSYSIRTKISYEKVIEFLNNVELLD